MTHRRTWSTPSIIITVVAMLALLLASPASAESACRADAAGDVRSQSDGTTVDNPRSDLLAVCVTYDGEILRLTARVAEPTDPTSDPAWDGQAVTVGMVVDTDGDTSERDGAPTGEDFVIELARFPQADGTSGPPEIRAYVAGPNNVLATDDGVPCNRPSSFDGTQYILTMSANCLGNPQEVMIAAYMYFNSTVADAQSVGLFDEVTPFPAYQGPYSSSDDPDTVATRLRGASRVETALAVSADDFAEGQAGSIVLARSDAFPDALSGAPLAVAADGPLLLTGRDDLPPSVEAEIQRILPVDGRVLLAGGESAISAAVATQLSGLGYDVVRVSGPTRYATSVEVAQATNSDPSLIVVANGNTFPEALVGGALAAAEGGVQILSNGTTLDETAAAYLADHPDAEVLAIGSTAAAAVPAATAIGDEDIFATSVAVAERYGNVTGVALASGVNFPDGLAGGAHAGRAGIPLLLSWPDVLPGDVQTYLSGQAPLQRAVLYGGTVALSNQIERDVAEFVS